MLLVQVQGGSSLMLTAHSPQKGHPAGRVLLANALARPLMPLLCLSQLGRDWSRPVPELGMAAISWCPPGVRADRNGIKNMKQTSGRL